MAAPTSRVDVARQAQALVERVDEDVEGRRRFRCNVDGGYTAQHALRRQSHVDRRRRADGERRASELVRSEARRRRRRTISRDEALERAVRQSEALAKLAPDDPEAMPALGRSSTTT